MRSLTAAVLTAAVSLSVNSADAAIVKNNLPLASFYAVYPAADGYKPFRASYELAPDDFVLRLSEETPHRTFGWLEGPRFMVEAADQDEIGAIAGMTVTFSFDPNYTGNAPELRARINSGDSLDYAVSGVAYNQFAALRSTGRGTVTATLDRRNLASDSNLRLSIDLFSFWNEGEIDPNFYVRIESVEVFSYTPESGSDTSNYISAAYMESDGDIYAHVGTARTRLRSTASSYAYDGSYAITLDDRALHAYSVATGLTGVEIEGDDVISAAISGQHVIYLQVDGDVNYYNIVTQEKKKIGGDEDYYLVTSGGGGNLLVAELGSGGWRLHRYDANAASPQLTRLTDDYDITFIRTRDTGREIGSGKNKKVFTSDLWTLFE